MISSLIATAVGHQVAMTGVVSEHILRIVLLLPFNLHSTLSKRFGYRFGSSQNLADLVGFVCFQVFRAGMAR